MSQFSAGAEGAAAGAQALSFLGPYGAIAGGILGAIGGIGASRKARRAKRKARHAEIMANVRIGEKSELIGTQGRRMAGAQRAAQGATGLGGRTASATTTDTAYQFFREQYALMQNVDTSRRKGGTRNHYAFKYLQNQGGR